MQYQMQYHFFLPVSQTDLRHEHRRLAMPYYRVKFSTKSYYKANILSDCQSILIINNSQSMFISVINLLGADTTDEKLRKDM